MVLAVRYTTAEPSVQQHTFPVEPTKTVECFTQEVVAHFQLDEDRVKHYLFKSKVYLPPAQVSAGARPRTLCLTSSCAHSQELSKRGIATALLGRWRSLACVPSLLRAWSTCYVSSGSFVYHRVAPRAASATRGMRISGERSRPSFLHGERVYQPPSSIEEAPPGTDNHRCCEHLLARL